MFGLDAKAVSRLRAYRARHGVAGEANGEGERDVGSGKGERLARAARALADAARPSQADQRPTQGGGGFRYLTRLLAAGLEIHLGVPVARRTSRAGRSEVPRRQPRRALRYVPLDALLPRAGQRGQLAFCVYDRAADGATKLGANLSDAQMRFEPDGSFELALAPERPEGATHRLRLGPEAASTIARQYFPDPQRATPARLEIEALPAAPPRLWARPARPAPCLRRALRARIRLSAVLSSSQA
jgi:hypothetical protein